MLDIAALRRRNTVCLTLSDHKLGIETTADSSAAAQDVVCVETMSGSGNRSVVEIALDVIGLRLPETIVVSDFCTAAYDYDTTTVETYPPFQQCSLALLAISFVNDSGMGGGRWTMSRVW